VPHPRGALDAQRVRGLEQVVDVRVEVPRRLPLGAAVAAEVDRDDALPGQPLGEPAEALPVRVDAVQAEDGRSARVAPLVRLEDQSSVSSPCPDGR
jgi:hypothetical protein